MSSPFKSGQDVSAEFSRQGLPSNFCHVPFTTMILEPDGTVGSCRMKGTKFIIGDARENTLDQIWNGPKIREWRRQFLSGDPQFCRKEVRCNGCHLCPDYNALLPHLRAQEVQEQGPLRLGLNLNGRCNLECRMCTIWQEPNGRWDQMGLWPRIEEMAAKVREIELFSGEPFIQKDTYRLIDRISVVNPECEWTFTTNGHWVLNDKIKESLDKIRVKHISVSIDSLLPEGYERIRRKGRLEVVLENLDRLIQYDRSRLARGLTSLNLKATFAIQRENWREIGSFHDFGVRMNLPVFRAFVHRPLDCSLLTLENPEKEEILGWYARNLNRDQLLHSRRVILPILDSLPPLARAHHLVELGERISDQRPLSM